MVRRHQRLLWPCVLTGRVKMSPEGSVILSGPGEWRVSS